MFNSLIHEISQSLNVNVNSFENEHSFFNLIYSLAGRTAIVSLWDNESLNTIQHFKNKIEKCLIAFSELNTNFNISTEINIKDIVEEIYRIYYTTGFFYHKNNYLTPANLSICSTDNIELQRGFPPNSKLNMSGLGFYKPQDTQNVESTKDLIEMFNLSKLSLSNYLNTFVCNIKENILFTLPDDTQFLQMDPPYTKGYWCTTPYKDGRYSLLRYGTPKHIYVLYYYKNDKYHCINIPEWKLHYMQYPEKENYQDWKKIASALLLGNNTLPPIKVKFQSEFAYIHLGYLLPPAEQSFLLLYSWPLNYKELKNQNFSRIMSKQIYLIFEKHLKTIGYSFIKE